MTSHPHSIDNGILIVGAGGQGLVVADILLRACERGGHRPVGFLDDNPDRVGSVVLGLPVLGPIDRHRDIPHDGIVVAIGDNDRRRALSLQLESDGEMIVSACHPSAIVAPDVEFGPGCMVSAGVVVVAGARIGRGVLLNTSCHVDHETIIHDFAHIGPGAAVGAGVTLGAQVALGMHATVVSHLSVGARTFVGAGAVVVRSLPEDVVAYGVPARIARPRA